MTNLEGETRVSSPEAVSAFGERFGPDLSHIQYDLFFLLKIQKSPEKVGMNPLVVKGSELAVIQLESGQAIEITRRRKAEIATVNHTFEVDDLFRLSVVEVASERKVLVVEVRIRHTEEDQVLEDITMTTYMPYFQTDHFYQMVAFIERAAQSGTAPEEA